MLNIFPIQFLAPLAYVLLRVVLGYGCMRIGIGMMQKPHAPPYVRALGIWLTVGGVSLLAGLLTQAGAVIAATGLMAARTPLFRAHVPSDFTKTTLFIMTAIAASIFITGAGPFAFDLPI